jgi:hypothetical protein
MDQNKVLSEKLRALGFLPVLGTTEMAGGRECVVGRGDPFSCDSNNGVFVVYDEDGSPWLSRSTRRIWERFFLVVAVDLRRGAYVPHSNDGGTFFHKYLYRRHINL